MAPLHINAPLSAHAVRYADEGFYVFPLHSPQKGTSRTSVLLTLCSCGLPLGRGKGECQAKHPRVAHWQHEATRDPDRIRAWWKSWPDAGIGIVTGKSGFFVIDLDVSEGKRGPDAWGDLQGQYGDEGSPQVLKTGSGGTHLVYRYREGITNSRGSLASGIDVRGAGGYIVAPPSRHWTGMPYSGHIDGKALSDPPSWLVSLITRGALPDAPPIHIEGSHTLTAANLRAFIEKKKNFPDAQALITATNLILEGRPWAAHGSRHTTMVALLGALRNFVLDTWDAPICAESLYEIFAQSLRVVAALPETQVTCDRQWFLDLYAKLSASDEFYRGKLALSRAQKARPNGDLLLLPADFPLANDRSWILGTNAGYFLRGEGGYVGPFSRELVTCKARDVLATAPVRLTSDEGRPLSLNTLMDRYGLVPTTVRYSYSVERSSLVGDAFVQRAGVAEKVTPEYNKEIATWLKYLGGAHHDALLDWLATVQQLDKPSCALCILGYSGAGKDLLIDGLSQLWGGHNTAFAVAIGKFNYSLLRSPLIVANERLSTFDRRDGSAMDALKELISSMSRAVADKNVRGLELDGSVRVVLATNNTGAFKLDKQPNESDLQALHDRMLLVRPTEEARPYLEQLGGRAHTEAWVVGRGIARHVEWLRQNRPVVPGPRLLVQGRGGLADLLTAEGTESGPVLQALLRCLLDPLLGDDNVCCSRGGGVWASQVQLKNLWATFGGRHELPDSLGDVFSTITETGSSKPVNVRGKLVRMRAVKLSVMRAIALREGLYDELEAKILGATRLPN